MCGPLLPGWSAINSANVLYRATLLGAMIKTGQTGPEARQLKIRQYPILQLMVRFYIHSR